MTVRRFPVSSSWGLFALTLGTAACSAGSPEPSPSTVNVRQADTTGALLWTATNQPTPGGVSVISSEVDVDGTTYILGITPQQDNVVVAFDPNGALLPESFVNGGEIAANEVRVNSGVFVVDSTQFGVDGVTAQARLDYVTPASNGTSGRWTYFGAAGTQAGAADLCEDGTAVLATLSNTGTSLLHFDPSGNVLWTAALPVVSPNKVRCFGNGDIVVAGLTDFNQSSASVSLARFANDGTLESNWSATDTGAARPTFDIIDTTTIAATTLTANGSSQYAVYAVAQCGNLTWSWTSGGPSDQLAGVSTSDVVVVTGSRGSDAYTVELDASGNLLWTRDDPTVGAAAGVSLDDADEAFVCSPTAEVLYDGSGNTVESTPIGFASVVRADVTNAVGRCIGASTPNSAAVAAFQLQ